MAWPTKTDFVDGDVLTAAQVNNIGTNLNVFNPTSATNGQVWVANGSGSGSYATFTSGGWTLINSGSMSGSSTITSSSFADYRQLHIDLVGVTTATAGNPGLRLNGISTSSYASIIIQPTSSSAWSNSLSTGDTMSFLGGVVDTSTYSIDVYNTSQTTALKNIVSLMTTTNTSFNRKMSWGQANIAAAMTSLTIFLSGTTFTAGNYYFYGLK
jgi:hypothetical protein